MKCCIDVACEAFYASILKVHCNDRKQKYSMLLKMYSSEIKTRQGYGIEGERERKETMMWNVNFVSSFPLNDSNDTHRWSTFFS